MTFSFSGPTFSLSSFVPSLAGAWLVGGLYYHLAKPHPDWMLLPSILIVREAFDRLFFQAVSYLAKKPSPRTQAKIYVFTNLTVNILALWALRRLQLIGNIATAAFAGLMIIEAACKYVDFSKYRALPN